YGAGLCVDADEGCASLLLDDIEQRATVRGPVEPAPESTARCGIIAENRAAHIEVVAGGQVLRFSVRCQVDDPEVGLRVGANGLGDAAVESQLAAVRAEHQVTNVHGDSGELFSISTRRRHQINIGSWEFVVGLIDALGNEVNPRAIVAPEDST